MSVMLNYFSTFGYCILATETARPMLFIYESEQADAIILAFGLPPPTHISFCSLALQYADDCYCIISQNQ